MFKRKKVSTATAEDSLQFRATLIFSLNDKRSLRPSFVPFAWSNIASSQVLLFLILVLMKIC